MASEMQRVLIRRSIFALLICIGFGYFGMILAVVVHEVVGHALAVRRRVHVSLPLLMVAINFLLEGPPYAFWNSLHPVWPGDFGKVWYGDPYSIARFATILISGSVMLASIWCFTATLLSIIESWICEGVVFTFKKRLAILFALGIAAGSTWFIFDWNQLAPGIGHWPNVCGLALHVGAGVVVAKWPLRITGPNTPDRKIGVAIAFGWGLSVLSVVLIALNLSSRLT
jgi:hypothetical protein